MFENPYGATASSQYDYVPSYAHGGYHFNYQGMGAGQTGGPVPTGGGAPTSPPSTQSSSGMPPVTRSNYFSTGTSKASGFRQYLDGIRTYSPVINEGVFVGGASDRSEVIEGRGGDVSAGNFLQRTESNKEKGFYKKGEKGMKVAEVTGNEVIMPADRQNKIEKALASGDTETPGKIMKQTLAEGKVTKGDASHDTNPMPIMSTGAVLDKNGKDTGLKADSGTGIYHQASKQFKPGMSNSEMTKIIKKNIQSWKKQGKA